MGYSHRPTYNLKMFNKKVYKPNVSSAVCTRKDYKKKRNSVPRTSKQLKLWHKEKIQKREMTRSIHIARGNKTKARNDKKYTYRARKEFNVRARTLIVHCMHVTWLCAVSVCHVTCVRTYGVSYCATVIIFIYHLKSL